MSLAQRCGMVDRVHPSLSTARQRVLLGVSRSTKLDKIKSLYLEVRSGPAIRHRPHPRRAKARREHHTVLSAMNVL